jgi:putative inorganic carbon (HCO3(-)) transporter
LDQKTRVYDFFSFLAKFGLGGMIFFIPISNALINTFFGFFLLGFTGRKFLKPDFSFLSFGPNVPLFLFVLFISLSLFYSGKYIETSLVALFLKWGKYILIYFIVQDTIRKRSDLFAYLVIFLFSAGLASLSGITQFFWGVEFLRGREIQIMKGGFRAITSAFKHCNDFGAFLIIPFFITLALFTAQKLSKLNRFLLLFLMAILVFCIFHTYSRGTWIGVLAGMCAIVFIYRRRQITAAMFFFLSLILLVPEWREIFLSIFKAGGDAKRFEYWQVAIEMFKQSPFWGQGLGVFMVYLSDHYPGLPVFYAHNCFLQILAESGIFGLIAFVAFVSAVLYLGIKRYYLAKDPILLGGICGIIGFLVHSFFDVQLYSLPLATLFWLWMGVIPVLSSLKSGNKENCCS